MTSDPICCAGVAQRTITPPVGSELGSYFHKRFAKAVKSELYTNAMVIEREAAPMAPGPIDYRLKMLKIPRLVKTAETDRMIDAIRNKPDANYLEKGWPPRYDAWDPEPAEQDVPVQCLRVGTTALVGLPCEAFTALGLVFSRPRKRSLWRTPMITWDICRRWNRPIEAATGNGRL